MKARVCDGPQHLGFHLLAGTWKGPSSERQLGSHHHQQRGLETKVGGHRTGQLPAPARPGLAESLQQRLIVS